VFVVNTPVHVCRIGVDFEAEEFVNWNQGLTQNEVCTDRLSLMKSNTILWPEDGGDGSVLEVGNYTFKFTTDIPENVPLNFEEQNVGATTLLDNVILPQNTILPITFGDEKSYIRYLAKGFVELAPDHEKLDNKMRFERIAPFKVVEQFDLSILAQPPILVNQEKSFMFGGNPISAEFSVSNGGVIFVGQKLFLHIGVKNQSSRNISGLYLRLDQFVRMKAHNNKGEEQSIDRRHVLINALIENSGVKSGIAFQQDILLEIPNFIPGSIKRGNFIDRSYSLNLDVELSFQGSMSLSVPLTLLEWTPQLKGIIPDELPTSTIPNTESKDNQEQQEEVNIV